MPKIDLGKVVGGGVETVNNVSPDESGNISLTAENVGARPSTWMPSASDVGALASSYKSDVDSLIKRWNVKTNANVCANVDNHAQTGFFHCDTATAGTKPSTHGELLHITEDPKWSEHQLFFTSGDQIWHRRRNNNGTANSAAWSAWKRIMPVQDIYPVGSIYLSVSSTSPASLFGGTWEQLRNRFLLGASNENAAGSTGGEASSTLSTENLPVHTHTMATGAAQPEGVGAPQSIYTAIVDKCTTASGHWYNQVRSGTNENANGESFSNMPPYLAVYMWKRVS